MKQSLLQRKHRHYNWVVAATALVLLWRIAASQWPSSFVRISEDLRLPMALMGMLFLICGLLAWWIRPGRWSTIFLFYGMAGGVHWGGAIGSTDARIELSLFFGYVAVTALMDAALLHLALVFPSGRSIARSWLTLLYFPAGVGLICVPIAGLVSQTTLQTVAGILLLLANILSVAAGLLFLIHLFRANSSTCRAAHLPLIGTSMVITSTLALLGEVLPGHAEAWNLTLALIPVCLAFALVSPALKALAELP